MRRLHTALGAGALLLAVTACADQSSDVGFGGEPPAPPAQQGPVEPKPEQERQGVPGNAVDASKLPESYPTDVWTQDNGKVVVATGQEGGCSEVHAEVAEQNDQQVRIVLVDETPEPAGACTMDLRYPPVAVALDEKLGDRTVVLEQRDVKVPRQEQPN